MPAFSYQRYQPYLLALTLGVFFIEAVGGIDDTDSSRITARNESRSAFVGHGLELEVGFGYQVWVIAKDLRS